MTDILLQEISGSEGSIVVEKQYKITNLQSFDVELNSPISPMPLPEDDAEANLLVKVEGNSETISISWTVLDEANDVVSGNKDPGKTITTASEQINYILKSGDTGFQPTSIEQNFRVQIVDGATVLFTRKGFFTKFSFNVNGSSPVVWNGRVSFITGDVITSYQTKVPKQPTSVTASAGSTGQIDMTWVAPTITNGTISDYVIGYNKAGDPEYSYATVGSATTSITLTGLESGAVYDIRVAAKTNVRGDWTDIISSAAG